MKKRYNQEGRDITSKEKQKITFKILKRQKLSNFTISNNQVTGICKKITIIMSGNHSDLFYTSGESNFQHSMLSSDHRPSTSSGNQVVTRFSYAPEEQFEAHFSYTPRERFEPNVSSKPRLYGPSSFQHEDYELKRVTPVTPVSSRRYERHQESNTQVTPRITSRIRPTTSRNTPITSSLTGYALQSHIDDTHNLHEKQAWQQHRFHPDFWTMFEKYDPHHPEYYANRTSSAPPSTAPAGGRRYNSAVLRKPHVFPLHLTNKLELVTQRPLLSSRPIGQRYSINPRWSSNCYGANTIR